MSNGIELSSFNNNLETILNLPVNNRLKSNSNDYSHLFKNEYKYSNTVDKPIEINSFNEEEQFSKKYINIINDQPLGEDYLNYNQYAKAFVNLLYDDKILLPITIGIYANWGSGKSFLLGKIKEYIQNEINKTKNKKIENNDGNNDTSNNKTGNRNQNQKQKYIIIDFNAWSYSFSDVLWAGLVKEIHSCVENEFGFLQLRCFRFFIYPFRSNPPGTIAWMVFYAIIRFIALIGLSILVGMMSYEDLLTDLVGDIAIFSVYGITIATIIPSVISLIITLCKDKGTEIMKGAKNIEDNVGFMGDVRSELDLLCDFIKMKKTRFAVFIDDLDRCPPDKIISMLDATMLLLSNLEYPFLTFIAIDPRIIVKAIESSFDEVLLKSGITGFEYLDKLIQIPFSIPIASPNTKSNIVRILTREKENVLNMVVDLCYYLHTMKILDFNNIYLEEKTIKRQYSTSSIIDFKNDKINISSPKKVQQNYADNYTYNAKMEYIKKIYICFKEHYGHILDAKYIFDLNNTSDILSFLLKIFRHIKNKHLEKQSKISKMLKADRTIKNIQTSKLNINDILSELLSDNQLLSNPVGELNDIRIDVDPSFSTMAPDIERSYTKISSGYPTDKDYVQYGTYLLERKNQEKNFIVLQEINESIKKYYKNLKKFLNNRLIKYSPVIDTLCALYSNFEKINRTVTNISKTVYFHSQSMLSKDEIRYFHSIAKYFDGNCRRNKKIINIYILVKNLLEDKIIGWYKIKPVTTYTLKILIKLIVLFEQWPYNMSIIFHLLEKYKNSLTIIPYKNQNVAVESTEKTQIFDVDQWMGIHKLSTLYDVYEQTPMKLYFHPDLYKLSLIDYNNVLFQTFLKNQQPIITVEYFYVCIGYIFNINYTIKERISVIDNYNNVINNQNIQ